MLEYVPAYMAAQVEVYGVADVNRCLPVCLRVVLHVEGVVPSEEEQGPDSEITRIAILAVVTLARHHQLVVIPLRFP